MENLKKLILVFASSLLLFSESLAQNPVIRNQFSADPTARVFNGRVYLFPSHDIPAPKEMTRKDWFVMEDYHVFSSANLTEWTDHGVIVSQGKVPWVNATTYSMWAPDCVERNGKYYFYFPANVKVGAGRGFGIGVAVADNPEGPFIPQPEPNAFIQYNSVDFGNKKIKSFTVNAFSTSGGTLEVRQDKPDGAIIGEIKIPASTGWSTLNGKMLKYKKGIHNLVVVLKGNNPVEVDWLQFIE